jgi:hypothetical protein
MWKIRLLVEKIKQSLQPSNFTSRDKKTYVLIKIWTWIFVPASFLRASKRKQLKGPTGERMNTRVHIYTVEYYSEIKWNEESLKHQTEQKKPDKAIYIKWLHLYETPGKTNLVSVDRKEIKVAYSWGAGTKRGAQGNFWGNKHVLHLNCSG